MKDYLLGQNAGGSREAITKGHIESVPILLPPLSLLAKFAEITVSIPEGFRG
jgi:restriction endonuclease S subunit